MTGGDGSTHHWWRDAVVYQVYVRSFADSDGDGIGDLDGIRHRLDDLASLGVDALWLNPCYPSPQRDHGYDVSDYVGIHPEYGTLETFDALVADARARGIRILMDLVPNHCSADHPWFVAALAAAPGGRERARFWFRDGRPDDAGDPHGTPPNNWRAGFGGPAWSRAGPDDPQWYLGTFTPHQPDLNHTHPDVRAMFGDVLRFWFDRGVDGFRVDAIQPVGKHPDLPDQPPVAPGTSELQVAWENPYNVFRPEGHEVWRSMRATVDEYTARHPGRDLLLLAEAYLVGRRQLLAEFARPDEFHQVFNFDLLVASWNVDGLTAALRDLLWLADHGVVPCVTLNNHDAQRSVTRLGRADAHVADAVVANALVNSTAPVDVDLGRRRSRALIALAMALPGSIYLYQGEELGLPEWLDLPDDRREDPVFVASGGAELGRDGCRIPLPWTRDPAGAHGFSARRPDGREPAAPWLPQPQWWGEFARAEQEDAPGSDLDLYRTLIAARREHAAPQPATAELLDLGPELVAVARGELVVVLNVGREPVALDADHPALASTRPVVATAPAELHTPGVIPPASTIWFAP